MKNIKQSLKTILNYFKTYVDEINNKNIYIYFIIFISFCVGLNYYFNFNDGILEKSFGKPIGMLYYILFYAFAYFGVAIPIGLIDKKSSYLNSKKFWIKSITFIALTGITGAFYFHGDIIQQYSTRSERYFLFKVLSQFRRAFVFTIPIIILYFLMDRDKRNFYGMNLKRFDPTIYLVLCLCVFPLAIGASFTEDFMKAYPRFKFWLLEFPILGLNKSQATLIFQFFYSIEFIYVEWVFRGMFALGMYWVMGKHAILPMVSVYAFLHFGKPAGETIGSIFGGFILGVIILNTKNIWGGVIVHLGMALSMEIAAYAQYFIRN